MTLCKICSRFVAFAFASSYLLAAVPGCNGSVVGCAINQLTEGSFSRETFREVEVELASSQVLEESSAELATLVALVASNYSIWEATRFLRCIAFRDRCLDRRRDQALARSAAFVEIVVSLHLELFAINSWNFADAESHDRKEWKRLLDPKDPPTWLTGQAREFARIWCLSFGFGESCESAREDDETGPEESDINYAARARALLDRTERTSRTSRWSILVGTKEGSPMHTKYAVFLSKVAESWLARSPKASPDSSTLDSFGSEALIRFAAAAEEDPRMLAAVRATITLSSLKAHSSQKTQLALQAWQRALGSLELPWHKTAGRRISLHPPPVRRLSGSDLKEIEIMQEKMGELFPGSSLYHVG